MKQTKNVPLRKDIRRYLSSRERRDVIEDPDYSIANINKKIAAGDLQFLSVFELYLTARFTFKSEEVSINALTSEREPGNSAGNRISRNRNTERSPTTNLSKQATTSYSSSQLDLYRQALFAKLNDSVRMPLKVILGLINAS